jgi:hypothetical protein
MQYLLIYSYTQQFGTQSLCRATADLDQEIHSLLTVISMMSVQTFLPAKMRTISMSS